MKLDHCHRASCVQIIETLRADRDEWKAKYEGAVIIWKQYAQTAAESQAREAALRDFVEEVRKSGDTRLASMAIATLSQPHDDTALRAAIAKAGEVMRERCAANIGQYIYRDDIRALPGVTPEDLQ